MFEVLVLAGIVAVTSTIIASPFIINAVFPQPFPPPGPTLEEAQYTALGMEEVNRFLAEHSTDGDA